ncbi:fatty acyl-AMP ligase [Paenibacillus dendritiformis]|uniref:fatty acyl-AMP ligase n=1 Tax=Paenibacillus dendritiformis TaxID=130049 RepID=UPI000DAAC1AD|nr:fatty acyl-AMP ligase [Paenibacillus dendritiformis]PZM66500.1 amino acid adenylation protein [Paenibacillus dendritiformis]
MYKNLLEMLDYTAYHYPDRKAFIYLKNGEFESESCTYHELRLRSQKLAAYFQFLNLSGERIMILLPGGIDYIIAFFGCLQAGALPVPAFPPSKSRNGQRVTAIYENAKPALLITQSPLDSMKLPEKMRSACSIQLDDILQRDDEFTYRAQTIPIDHIAFLQYTSGSTNTPKGVMVSHRNLLHNLEIMKKRFYHSNDTIMVSWLPMYHDMGLIGNVLQNVYNGGSCYLMSPMDFIQKPIRWLRTITKYRATFSGAPDFAYRLCVQKITDEDKQELNLSPWAIAFNGSEPVRAETIREFCDSFHVCGFRDEALLPSYGLAEATLCVTVAAKEAQKKLLYLDDKALQQNNVAPVKAHGDAARAQVGCGSIFSDQQIKIVDPSTKLECEAGEIGEIWIKGESVAQGYWDAPVESEATFAAYLLDSEEGPFLRTGDLGFVHGGELYIAGRLKDLIIIRGQNYYPQDIEEIAASCHPDINGASLAAFSIEVQGGEELVVVCEMNREFKHAVQRQQLDWEACCSGIAHRIREAIAEQLQLYAYDVKLVKPLNLPKTTSNKIQRRKCKEMYLNGSLFVWGGLNGQGTGQALQGHM